MRKVIKNTLLALNYGIAVAVCLLLIISNHLAILEKALIGFGASDVATERCVVCERLTLGLFILGCLLVLKDAGCDLGQPDYEGYTPASWAVHKKHDTCLQFLKDAGFNE